MFQHPGVGGDSDVGKGRGWQQGAAAIRGDSAQPEVVGRVPLPLPLGMGQAQVVYRAVDDFPVGVKKPAAGLVITDCKLRLGIQFPGEVEVTRGMTW